MAMATGRLKGRDFLAFVHRRRAMLLGESPVPPGPPFDDGATAAALGAGIPDYVQRMDGIDFETADAAIAFGVGGVMA